MVFTFICTYTIYILSTYTYVSVVMLYLACDFSLLFNNFWLSSAVCYCPNCILFRVLISINVRCVSVVIVLVVVIT